MTALQRVGRLVGVAAVAALEASRAVVAGVVAQPRAGIGAHVIVVREEWAAGAGGAESVGEAQGMALLTKGCGS